MEHGPKKTALWFLIASVAVSAVLGIWAILSGNFGELQARVLLTTLTITGASICGLACGAYWETGRNRWLPGLGMLLALAAAALVIFGIWYQTSGNEYWKFSASVGLVAIATAHVSLLSLARLARRFRLALAAAYVFAYLLATLLIIAIYGHSEGDLFARIIGVTAILLAAVSLIVPIFHRMSASELKPVPLVAVESAELWPTVTCPRCGTPQANSRVEINCENCRCRFRIEILPDAAAELPATTSGS